MQVDFNLNSNISATSSVINYHIVSKFFIKDSCFLVISAEPFVGGNQQFVSNIIIDNDSFATVGYFKFDGHSYLIVNSQNSLTNVNDEIINLLTGRELQITVLVALGWSNKEVAKQLQISDLTVSAHLRRIYVKLKVSSRSAMVYRCASLIKQLQDLQPIQYQMSSTSQSKEVAKLANNQQNIQHNITEIDRLLCSALAISHLISE